MKSLNLPASWKRVTLGDVAADVPYAIVDGPFGSNLKTSDYVEMGVPVLQGKNITNDAFKWFDVRYISKNKAEELKRSSVRVGDILLVKIGSIGYSAIVNSLENHDFAIIPANLVKITSDSSLIDIKYLHRWLTAPITKNYLLSNASKTAQPALSLGKIRELPLLLPPLPEQRRIAAILDQADLLRVKRREALAELDRLTQSIFVEMFGDLMGDQSQWETQELSNFIMKFESGKSVAADDEDDETSNYQVLKVSAVTSLEYRSSESKAAPSDYVPQQSYFVKSGDLLFSRANTTELIGATAFVNSTPENILLSDKLWRFVWHEVPRAEVQFVNYLFRQKKFREEIGRRASGTSGSMKNISQEKVLSIRVGLPPLELQRVFSNRIEYIEKIKGNLKKALVESNSLFTSLQHLAFRGEL